MDTYSFLRELADSWVLLAMFVFFLATWVWAFWPGLRRARDDASEIPFRNDTPACSKNCENCPCDTLKFEEPTHG